MKFFYSYRNNQIVDSQIEQMNQ